LQSSTKEIGTTQATLRAAHLKYHLATIDILTPGQVARYIELPAGFKDGEVPTHHRHQ